MAARLLIGFASLVLMALLAAGPALAAGCPCREARRASASDCARDCCHELRRVSLQLHHRRVCLRHEPVTPEVPCAYHCRRTQDHMPVETCYPCGEPARHCDCHEPAVAADVSAAEDCGCGCSPPG